MKKALALVLALVLALSLGVSAFAVTVVPLAPDAATEKDGRLDLSKADYQINFTEGEKVFRATYNGGVYYLLVDATNHVYKDISVVSSGCVAAEIVKYDPATMKGADDEAYTVYDNELKTTVDVSTAIDTGWDELVLSDAQKAALNEKNGIYNNNPDSYPYFAAVAKELNTVAKSTKRFEVKSTKNYYVVKLTVEPNYSVAYKEGSFKVKATEVFADKTTKSLVSPEYTVISDVSIFEYEMVVWAGSEGKALEAGKDKGYSDYDTQGKYGADYVVGDLREFAATVVSTTEFRTLREKVKSGLAVNSNGLLVEIKEVAAGQKGVNFASTGVKFVDANKDLDIEKVAFGFLGNQVIASDFTITVNLGVSAYKLREEFGKAVEEDDVITYYVLKDGKVVDSFTVDYMKDEIDEKLELVINGKAGETLGYYELVLEVPAAPEAPSEENPNTGAESVIGVVAAMAVVSVAAAAAVSLKK